MSLLANINDNFFNPFCCKNKEVYWDCINLLIELSKTVDVLYEKDAKDRIALYLGNCQYALETENIGDEISSKHSAQDNAAAILRYFRRCGWLSEREIGRSGDNIASVGVYCRKLVSSLEKIFNRDANGAITNHIFSVYEILKFALERDSIRAVRPYTNILEPLLEHENDLKNELLQLKDSIKTIMRLVMKLSDTNSFGQFLLKDEMLQRFFNDYFFIKRSGLIPVYLKNINQSLYELRHSPLVDNMAKEYVTLHNAEYSAVKEKINSQLEQLENFLNLEYDNEMSYIDRRINTYYNLYSVRMTMIFSNSNNMEQQLNRLLLVLKELPDKERRQALEKLSVGYRLSSYGFVGAVSIKRRRRANPNTRTGGLQEEILSEAEKKRLTDELLKEYPDSYSIKNASAYFNALLKGNSKLTLKEEHIRTREDAMMVAAGIIYSGARDFPFQVQFRQGLLVTKVAKVSRIDIVRMHYE